MLTKHDSYCCSTETIRGSFAMIINSENPFFLATDSFTSTTFPTLILKNPFGVYIKSENNVCMAIYMQHVSTWLCTCTMFT